MVCVIIISALVALASYFSYGTAENRTAKTAMAVIMLYTVASPIVSLVSELSEISFDLSFDSEDFESGGTEFAETAEEAFCDGICAAIAERYGLDRSDVRARALGFEPEKMRADKITVTLFGSAALADHRAIAQYITESGLGECEVKIEIG